MKLLKRTFLTAFCIAFVFLFSKVVGQNNMLKNNTTLYEYGTVITSEDNLKNLFENFPVYIDNGKNIDFLSYRFVETITNKRAARKYVQRNFNDLLPIGWNMITPDPNNQGNMGISSITYQIRPVRESKSELRAIMNTLIEDYIHTGDEVYVIEFVENMQKHQHYVFINPNRKKVLLKGNIFGVEIPLTHVAYIEQRNKK